MRQKVNLLSDQRLLRKFCQRQNKDYHCGDDGQCISCPLAHAVEVQRMMNMKNLTFGYAYQSFERQSLTEEEEKEIIRSELEKRGRKLREKKDERA